MHLDYDASWQTLLALAEANGVGRAVLLQPSFLGFDNSYLLGALKAEPNRFRGVPWISPSVETLPDDWEEMARLGVRGLRFPIFGLPTPQWSAYGDMLGEALKRDWPIHLYVESKRLPEILPFLLDGGHKVVIPHYGMFDRTLGPARDPGLQGPAGEREERPRLRRDVRRLSRRSGAGTAGRTHAARRLRPGAPDVGQRLAAHRHQPQPRHDLSDNAQDVRGLGARRGGTAHHPHRHAVEALRVLSFRD